MKYKKELAFYRNNKAGTGFAGTFKLSELIQDNETVGWAIFLTMAAQIPGERSFAWKDKSVTVKLGENDIGNFLAVLNRNMTSAGGEKGLYHESPKGGFKVIEFKVKDDHSGYYLKVSGSDAEKKSLGNFALVLSMADGELLRVLLSKAVEVMYDW
jgi:hypothetical protein